MAKVAEKLRITFVIPYFYPAWEYGGQPRSAYELAKALVQRGHLVKVLTTDSGGRSRLKETGKNGRCQVDGIEIVYYRNLSNWLAYRYRLFLPLRMFRDLEYEIKGSDIVHIHELRSTTSVLGYRAARRVSLPYILSGHGGLKLHGRAALKTVYDRLWGHRILRDAEAVIAVSPIEETDARDMGVRTEKIQRLPNIVPNADYQVLPSPGTFRQRWSTPEGKIILFLGRLHPLKGADLLVEAFSRVIRAQPKSYLVIAGPDDGQESALRRTISKLTLDSDVRFTGFLDLTAKKEALVDASVVVVPSRSEVFAITAVEALMCGTPVLLSSACGLDPLLEPQDCITFFRNEDIGDLAAKLAEILQDGPHSKAAHASQDFIAQAFNPQVIGREAEEIYRHFLK